MNKQAQANDCDLKRADAFLRSNQYQLDDADFIAHLDSCETCRAYLEANAADSDAWHRAGEMLQPCEFDKASAASFSAATLIGGHSSEHPVAIQDVLDTLAPTDDPHRLGRLGHYEISGVIGVGGMGVVLKAHDPSLERVVAVKVMAPQLCANEKARKRFAREAKAAAAVLHPNVIPIHSVSADGAIPYLVMSYVRGGSLQKRIENEGPLQLAEVLRIGSQIAGGLAAAHDQGLVHRDIKPENILLEEGVERVTITDFGLARAVDDNTVTQNGAIAGTPMYMSPEQARGDHVDQQSDLFSLGSVLYALCTGRPPFRSDSSFGVMRQIIDEEPTPVSELNPNTPDWLSAIISKLMSKKKSGRLSSAGEVQRMLEACLSHVQQPEAIALPQEAQALLTQSKQSTQRPNPLTGVVKKLRQHAVLAIALTIATAIGGGLVAAYFVPYVRAHQQASVDYDIIRKWLNTDEPLPAHVEDALRRIQASDVGRSYLWRLDAEFPQLSVLKDAAAYDLVVTLLATDRVSQKTELDSWYHAGDVHGHVGFGTDSQLELNSIRYVTREPNEPRAIIEFTVSVAPADRSYIDEHKLQAGGRYEVAVPIAELIKNEFSLHEGAKFLGVPESSKFKLRQLQGLEGSWQLASCELSGKTDSRAFLKRDNTLTFSAGRVDVELPLMAHKSKSKYAIDTTSTPLRLDILERDDTRWPWLYELKDNTLRVCIPQSSTRPTTFDTKEANHFVMTFTRSETRQREGANEQSEVMSKEVAKRSTGDLENLQGTWQAISVADGGRVVPTDDARRVRFVFTPDKLTMLNGPQKEPLTFRLNPNASPKQIDIVRKNGIDLGIYEINGDTLRLCLPEGHPGERPTAFESKPNSANDVLFTLKRVPDDDQQTIVGTWQMTYGEDSGRIMPPTYLKDSRFIFGEKKSTMIMGGNPTKATYRIDSTTEPMSIDFTEKGETKQGIYEFEGETLRVCFKHGPGRPQSFTDRDLLLMFKRVNAKSSDARNVTSDVFRTLLPEAASSSTKDFRKLAESAVAIDPNSFKNQSLTFTVMTLANGDKDSQKDFRIIPDAIRPSELAAAMTVSQWKGYISVIQPQYITDCTVAINAKDESEARGWVSFKAPKLYEGKVHFEAKKIEDTWKIVEFSMPNRGVTLVLGKDGNWQRLKKAAPGEMP